MNNFGHWLKSMNQNALSHMYFGFYKFERSNRIVFMLFGKFNDYQTLCFNFGLRRVHPNDCKFDLNGNKSKSKTKPSLE